MVIIDVPGTMMSRSSMGKTIEWLVELIRETLRLREPHDGMIQNIATVG